MEYEIQEHLHKQSPLVPIWPVHLLDLPTKNRVLQTLFKLVVLTVLGKKTWRKRYNKICDLLKLYLKKIDGVFSTWYPEDIYKCLVFVVMNCLWSKTMPLWIDEASDTLPLLWPYFVSWLYTFYGHLKGWDENVMWSMCFLSFNWWWNLNFCRRMLEGFNLCVIITMARINTWSGAYLNHDLCW